MTEEEWDSVIKVHLKGTFAPSHHAAIYWRERAKEGLTNDARIINTTSVSGIYGNAGQSNYGAAKAGIAAFTRIASMELGRYGVTVNAIAPGALTRMTEDLGMSDEFKEQWHPRYVSPIVTWLASPLSADVTGQIIEASGRARRHRRALAPWPEGRPDRGPARRRRDRPPPHRRRRPRHHHGRGALIAADHAQARSSSSSRVRLRRSRR